MLTVIFLSIAGVMCAVLLKRTRPEISYCLNLLLCVMIAFFALHYVREYLSQMQNWKEILNGYEEYLQLLFKMIGVTYLCEVSADICKDAGYTAIASQITIFGKCMILLVGIPIIQNLLGMVEQFW